MDIPFARKTLEYIEAHRSDGVFDMGHWARKIPAKRDTQGRFTSQDEDFCNTAACIAGHAVLLDPQFKKLEWLRDFNGTFANRAILQDGTAVDIEDHGRELLGISTRVSNSLFFLEDDEAVEALRQLIERVDAGEDPDTAYQEIADNLF